MRERDNPEPNKNTTIFVVALFCLCLILGGVSKIRERYEVSESESSLTETTEYKMVCRECGTAIPAGIVESEYHYCYSCGAKMIGEQDETIEH